MTCTVCDPLRLSDRRCEEEPPNCLKEHRFIYCCDCNTYRPEVPCAQPRYSASSHDSSPNIPASGRLPGSSSTSAPCALRSKSA
jgi:hypothetical protein